ncbi:hypothetical protein RhiirA5_435099 [Rhizophagus irregularis]|uniref:Uncharacterized protein n=1 Tax=Rhizophagus irregularis TaxID=588596 RepID=A0A2N0NNY0_9GLOM|nr:hypothetical protein RhiirA5_435099 [Rhizophagus irregularis]
MLIYCKEENHFDLTYLNIEPRYRNVLLTPPTKPFKDVYEIAKIFHGLSSIVIYRNRLRDVLLEGVPVQWNKKCIKYVRLKKEFEDGSRIL